MVWLTIALVLMAGLGAAAPAAADEPGDIPRQSEIRARHVVRSYVDIPRLVPDCQETWHSNLLRCAPRTYVQADDVTTLNALNALPSRVRRPYPELFAW